MSNNKSDNLQMDWEPGQLLLGDFDVERVLGQGGMGKVYLVQSRITRMQFAVKRALIRDDNNRQNFLSELQTWIDLPEHPNIAACRFFRTIGEEIAIFAEYVDGGTLADWIRDRRLSTLDQILDVAIQFAHGLHALHEHGLIHQDVKPGNVLMTQDMLVKVTDFGLARARLRSGDGQFYSPGVGADNQSVLVSFGGMTRAYCSPEQAQIEAMRKIGTPIEKLPKLSRRTDVWSWGVSLLDIFYGGVCCRYGQTAGEALEAYFKEGPFVEGLPRMPVEMTMVLGKCFLPRPEQRWNNMSDLVDALVQLYQTGCGRDYARQIPPTSFSKTFSIAAHDRRTAGGLKWADPREWLRKAFNAAGLVPDQADARVLPGSGSRRAQAIADMALYEEAYRLFEKLIEGGRCALEDQFASLCLDKALVHESAGDVAGAAELAAGAIKIRESLVNQEGRQDLAPGLASAYSYIASAMNRLTLNEAAVWFYSQAIEILGPLVEKGGQEELIPCLTAAYSNKASVLSAMGDWLGAVEFYDHSIKVLEHLVHQVGLLRLADGLATAYMNKAVALRALGEKRDAMVFCDRAIEIWEPSVNKQGRHDHADALAMAWMNKAMIVQDLGDSLGALSFYTQAIEIWERLVNQEGKCELAYNLARAYVNKASAVSNSGDKRGALAIYDHAIQIWERLVNLEGQRELADSLALAWMNKANVLFALDDKLGAIALYDRAAQVLERMINEEGRKELSNDLATTYMNKAIAVNALGDKPGAVAIYDRAIEILERLVNQEGHQELVGDLAWDKAKRAEVLLNLGKRARGLAEANEAIAMLRAEIARTERADLKSVLNWLTNVISKVDKQSSLVGNE